MELADEELINKFDGMHTAESVNVTIVTIPIKAVISRQWDLCILALVCTDRLVFHL